MRAVVQRVTRAAVRVEGKTIGEIGAGLMVLVGIAATDTPEAASTLAEKVATLRIFADDAGKMNLSVVETGGAVLAVSQFTLHGDARKGRRPNFMAAAPPELAEPLYESFLAALRDIFRAAGLTGPRVESGVFRAMMEVELVNDGPVTILLDTDRGFLRVLYGSLSQALIRNLVGGCALERSGYLDRGPLEHTGASSVGPACGARGVDIWSAIRLRDALV